MDRNMIKNELLFTTPLDYSLEPYHIRGQFQKRKGILNVGCCNYITAKVSERAGIFY